MYIYYIYNYNNIYNNNIYIIIHIITYVSIYIYIYIYIYGYLYYSYITALFLYIRKKEIKSKSSEKVYMKSFSNETLNFFFRKFWVFYILYHAKTV